MKTKKPLVSIIILNWNGLKDTLVCISSILKNSKGIPLEIVVVDNGSKENEAEVINKKFGTRVKTIRTYRNLGFTGGNNMAFKRVVGRYVVFLNNDTYVTKGWLRNLVNVMGTDKNIGVAQPKILLMNNKKSFDYSGAVGGFIDRYGYPFTQGRIFNTLEKDFGQYDTSRNIFWASSACMIVRKDIVPKAAGLFDDIFFNYMEEIDFCWRVWSNGFRVVVVPKSIIFHKVAGSARRVLLKKRFWEHRNSLILLYKNLNEKELGRILFFRSLFEVVTYFYYLVSGQFRFLLSLFLAHLDFFRLLVFNRIKRNQKLVPLISLPKYDGSIVIDYFLRGERYFRGLNWFRATAERTVPGRNILYNVFVQHKRAYQFCSQFVKGKNVLELGCGSGFGSFLLSRKAKSVLAIDKDVRSIKSASFLFRKENLRFQIGDVTSFKTKSLFDAVVSLQVIEHIEDAFNYLSIIISSLKRGGVAIISTPNRLTQSYNENPYHIREYSAQELHELLLKFFSKVTIKGLHGDKFVKKYEEERKKEIRRILKIDLLSLRKLLPKRILILIFEFFVPIVRKKLAKRYTNIGLITEKNYLIKDSSEGSIDLIAICRK